MIESLQDAYNKGEYLIIQIDHLNDRDLKEFFDGMAKAFTENEFKRTVIVNSTNRLRSKNANEFVQYMKEKMTVPIKCNKKIILYLSNRLFGWLHRSLMKIAEENGVNEEGPIADFLEKPIKIRGVQVM